MSLAEDTNVSISHNSVSQGAYSLLGVEASAQITPELDRKHVLVKSVT